MSVPIRVLLGGIIILIIDWYFYQAVSTLLKGASDVKRNVVFYSYWGFTVLSFLILMSPMVVPFYSWPKYLRVYLFAFIIMVIISKLIGSVFVMMDDLIRLFRWIWTYVPSMKKEDVALAPVAHGISRLKFLNYVAVGMAALPFMSFIYGMAKGAFDYKIHRLKVVLPKLPSNFNGLKIVQISDIHSGSFVSTTHIEEAVKLIMKENADIIFFTGDLVNDRATETEPFVEVLSRLKAPMGVFSTLGNHDYGDYTTWESAEAKMKNLDDLKQVHAKMGWKLMMNEHVVLEKGGEEIALLGIENWGGNFNFPKYGDMKKAYIGTEKYPVKLLLSHDPSHWNKQVKTEYKDVDITFSGHTHGFQFGIEIPGLRWSPSQYVYKQWAGLYQENNQYLYVNRGLGFLGYPGRVGILPEITVMELSNV
ncbi:MAG: metallophosphoesterase [Bacteroidota bacterium]